ncbi:MAG: sigma-70 family RNA polymerase sigma factor [Patescibacteria group bacterium]
MLEGEHKLIEQAKDGQQESFGKLYDHYITPIYRFVMVKVNHRDDAEDLTHEVFLSAWQNLKNYKFQGFPFSSWLYQIARNKVIDHYRTKKMHSSIDDVDENIFEIVGALEKGLDTSIALETVKEAIASLSPDQQDVLVMKFVEDLNNGEIATALKKSDGAVRLLQHRAINNLKAKLISSENNESKKELTS